jgi:hypothetical protein
MVTLPHSRRGAADSQYPGAGKAGVSEHPVAFLHAGRFSILGGQRVPSRLVHVALQQFRRLLAQPALLSRASERFMSGCTQFGRRPSF